MSSAAPLRVSIVVPVHNGGDAFGRCLASLAALDPPPHEVIVVADGESDGAWRAARRVGIRTVLLERAGGPARARNRGAEMATGDILLFVDADVEVQREMVAHISRIFTDAQELDAVIGSYDDAPAAANFLSQYKNLFHHYEHQRALHDASTFWGACGAIRRSAFATLGGFDERFRRASIEDIELGVRLRRAGRRIRLDRDLQVKHLKRWGVSSLLRADLLYRAVPWTRLILREGGGPNDLNLRWSNRASVALLSLCLGSSAVVPVVPPAIVPAILSGGAILALNQDLYRFFYRKRGAAFALKAIPWHWLYLGYCGAGFSGGLALHLVDRGRARIRDGRWRRLWRGRDRAPL